MSCASAPKQIQFAWSKSLEKRAPLATQLLANIQLDIDLVTEWAYEVGFRKRDAHIVTLTALSAGGPRAAIYAGAFLAFMDLVGLWTLSMQTLALLGTAALISIGAGIPLGIFRARRPRVYTVIRPILDFQQTMPAFVYMIPFRHVFRPWFEGIGRAPIRASVRRVLIRLGRWAGAGEVAVAVDVVDAGDGRPVLVLARAGQWEERSLLRVRAVPALRDE